MKFEVVLDVDDAHPVLTDESDYDLLFMARLAFQDWDRIEVVSVEPIGEEDGEERGSIGVEEAKTPGEELAERRVRVGLTVRDLSKRSGIDRATIARAERGEKATRAATFGVLHRVLDEIEQERGPTPRGDDAKGNEVEFQVLHEDGLSVTLRGPVGHAEELSRSIARLLDDLRPRR